MIVVVAPGQGSQTPSFLGPWLELDGMRERIERYADAAGVDLVRHGTVSDADTIRDTSVAQPLIVAASLASWAALAERAGLDLPDGVAGHSVGEFAAAAIARVLDEQTALRLVGVRARAMADAASAVRTGMSAVVGADETELAEALDRLGLAAANYNGAGQVVVAGDLDALARLAEQPPARARVIPLQVAGAFHTATMAPARAALARAAAAAAAADPATALWTNSTGARVDDGRAFVDLLVSQVASPVRWDRTMESFAAEGVEGIVELAPAGALVGLAKRALRGVPAVAVTAPDDLESAAALVRGAA